MKRQIRYVSTIRNPLFLTILCCLLATGLAGAVFRPASAARAASMRVGAQSGAAPQKYVPQVQKVKIVQPTPDAVAQERLHGMPLNGGSILESGDRGISCRVATEEEVRVMRRDSSWQLHVLGNQTSALKSSEQGRKGLKIVLRGTPQLEQFPEAKEAFLRAASIWESLIQNPITVVIDVDFGPTFLGEPYPEKRLGLTHFQRGFISNVYPIIRSALIKSAGSPHEAALYNSLPAIQLPTDLGAATGMIYQVATLRALGLLAPVADPDGEEKGLGLPPAIGFNSAGMFDFDPSDGIGHKRTDFTALALHEIGHALGFFSGVGIKELFPDAPLTPEMLDLFRFRPGVTSETFTTAPRILSSGGDHVFFDGVTELPLSTGRDDYTGGDGWQAGHWKADNLIGRNIGNMSPYQSLATRYEMTANDVAAFELLGYRMNPLPNPREAELKLDDWAVDGGTVYNELMVINRLTPPSYPATLRKLRILIPQFSGFPDPTGKPITLLIGTQSNSNGELPPGAQFKRIETTVPSASPNLFLEFTIPDGPTIDSGDFYVGYQAPSPHQGVGFAVDLSGSAENRSFYSTNDGASYVPVSEIFEGKAANAMIRALVSVGPPLPTPTPAPIPPPNPTPSFNTFALTSGVPYNGTMVEWSPDGIAFLTQFTIEVPSGAKQLKIDLSADTDLDLFARFGSLVAINNGVVISDFKSESDDNQESITITPAGSPALQAGTYYLMIVNFGPGSTSYTLTATVDAGSGPTPGKVVNVSAASYNGDALASDEIVSAFGEHLATTVIETCNPPKFPDCLQTEVAGTRVAFTDSAGTQRLAPLFFISPNQINYLVPSGLANGTATVTVTSGDGAVSVGTVQIAAVAPGLFTANGDGKGVPVAAAMHFPAAGEWFQEYIYQFDAAQNRYVPLPIDLGNPNDQVSLFLYGTGLRYRSNLSTVSVKIGGVEVPVLYAGPQYQYPGTDQVNVSLPRSLIGRGEMDLVLTVDGKQANPVRINIK